MKKIFFAFLLILLLFAPPSFALSLSGTLAADQAVSPWHVVYPHDTITYSITPDASESGFIGTTYLETSKNQISVSGFIVTYTGTVASPNTVATSGTYFNSSKKEPIFIRVRIEDIDTDNDSDDIDWTLVDVANVLKDASLKDGEVKTKDGDVLLRFNEGGIAVPGTMAITGATTQTGLLTTAANISVTAPATDALVGSVGTAPVSGTNAVTIERVGSFFRLTFTLTACQIPVTDGAGSGSHGPYKLFDFAEGGVLILGSRQDYTAYSPDATGVPNDAVFEIGLGSTIIAAAADGTLAATEDDIGGDVNQTLTAGTTTGTAHTGATVAMDGTTTAKDLNLNWSGTAATIDGNGTIDVTGTITVVGMLLGDD